MIQEYNIKTQYLKVQFEELNGSMNTINTLWGHHSLFKLQKQLVVGPDNISHNTTHRVQHNSINIKHPKICPKICHV